MDVILGRMRSRYGISFYLFCTSIDIRQLLRAKGFKGIPASPNRIQNGVMVYCRKVMGIVTSELKENVGLHKPFTPTLD